MEALHCRRAYWRPICDMTNDVGDEASVAPREAKRIERSPCSISLKLIRLSSAADRNRCVGFSAKYLE